VRELSAKTHTASLIASDLKGTQEPDWAFGGGTASKASYTQPGFHSTTTEYWWLLFVLIRQGLRGGVRASTLD